MAQEEQPGLGGVDKSTALKVNTIAADDIRNLARSREGDRYLAALLAPRGVRHDLIILAAFAADLHRIVETVSEPMLGEIRLQWWRDALAQNASEKTGHPLADAFRDVMQRRGLPANLIDDHLDAHAHRLHMDVPDGDGPVDIELDLIEGVPFQLAAKMLGAPDSDATRAAIAAGGRAYGLMRFAAKLPVHMARNGGSAAEPEKIASRARANLAAFRDAANNAGEGSKALMTAMLPLAVVEPHLRALQREGHDPARHIAEIAPLTQAWRIGIAHLRSRI